MVSRITDGDLDINLDDYEDYFEPQDRIHDPAHWRDKVAVEIAGGGKPIGDEMPWGKARDHFRFRAKELTLWSGYNGHWKSMVISQCFLWMLLQGRKCLIASFELSPEKLIYRMIRQALATARPTDEAVDKFYQWTCERMYIYEHEGVADRSQLRKVLNYAAGEHKVRHVLIDSLMMCGIGPEDYAGQKEFVRGLVAYAKNANCHVHLVAHSKKRLDESVIPGKMDIHGSQNISDMAANILICHRNKAKEAELQKESPDPDIVNGADFKLICDKQNFGNGLPKFKFWWIEEALQLSGFPEKRMFACQRAIMEQGL